MFYSAPWRYAGAPAGIDPSPDTDVDRPSGTRGQFAGDRGPAEDAVAMVAALAPSDDTRIRPSWRLLRLPR
jgi:hypothetical protein